MPVPRLRPPCLVPISHGSFFHRREQGVHFVPIDPSRSIETQVRRGCPPPQPFPRPFFSFSFFFSRVSTLASSSPTAHLFLLFFLFCSFHFHGSDERACPAPSLVCSFSTRSLCFARFARRESWSSLSLERTRSNSRSLHLTATLSNVARHAHARVTPVQLSPPRRLPLGRGSLPIDIQDTFYIYLYRTVLYRTVPYDMILR